MPPSSGLKCMRQRPKRRRQRDVQADRASADWLAATLAARSTSARSIAGADHHHRGRVETAALDQVADGAVDAGAMP